MTARIPSNPSAWHLVTGADGITLVPPSGIADGVVRIRDVQRPLQTAVEIVERVNTPPLASGAIESLITNEGEYAAFCVQRGAIDRQRVARFTGIVFGDDAYTLIVGLTTARLAELFEPVVRTCVTRTSLGLGHRRQRRYRYAPPAAWTETQWGLASRWSAADSTELVVHPAQLASTDLVLEAVRARHRIALDEEPAPRGPCLARAWRGEGLSLVILDDGRFRYPVELRGDDTHRETLARVVASIRLVPPAESVPITDAVLHWAE